MVGSCKLFLRNLRDTTADRRSDQARREACRSWLRNRNSVIELTAMRASFFRRDGASSPTRALTPKAAPLLDALGDHPSRRPTEWLDGWLMVTRPREFRPSLRRRIHETQRERAF